jgi:polysaccharide biosynthesis/export protein
MQFNNISAFALLTALFLTGLSESTNAQSKKRRDDITYFQDLAPSDTSMRISTGPNGTVSGPYVYRLQPGDILAIAVSSLNTEADVAFNPFARTGFTLSSGANNSQENNNLPIGYRVSETGLINFPKLGTVRVEGKTLSGLETMLRDTLRQYLREPFVSARLLNFKISVMGEVNRPSVYTVQNEKITLTEAISLAGDLTVYGKRDNVMIIRETAGQREFLRVDLTQRNTFSSEAYYLKPNDVIYVEPKSSKKVQASRTLPILPSILGGLTLLATIVLNLVR